MCGRFGQFSPPEELARNFKLDQVPELAPKYNVAPSQTAAVVCLTEEGAGRELRLMKWGLMNRRPKKDQIPKPMINARSETVHEKSAFKEAYQKRRGLIPADGFYEWAGKKDKKPYYFKVVQGGPFAMAGIWERLETDKDTVESFAILTTSANELVKSVHDRMPVIIDPADFDLWLGPFEDREKNIAALLSPFPEGKMESWPVGSFVNSIKNEGPRCIEPASEEQLSLLP